MDGMIDNFAASIQLLRKAAVIGASTTALLILATSARADNLVQNGGFETNSGAGQVGNGVTIANWNMANPGAGAGGGGFGAPAFPGYTWLYAAGTGYTLGPVPLWGPADGSANGFTDSPLGGYFIGQDSAFEPDAIEQTITGLTVGETYTLNFDWAAAQQKNFTGPTNDNWTACLGATCQTTSTVGIASEGFAGWFNQSFTYTATGASELLMFYSNGDDVPSGLPNPSQPPFALLDDVSLTPTPEPGTLPLLFTGLMGGLGVLRSRKWLKR